MKLVVFVILTLLSKSLFAGGNSEKVNLISLTQTESKDYVLMYESVKTAKIYTINLSYSRFTYLFNSRFLTSDKFDNSISLLKSQLKQGKTIRFGWFGGGPCLVNKGQNIYRSDALDVLKEKGKSVVYAFCEYR